MAKSKPVTKPVTVPPARLGSGITIRAHKLFDGHYDWSVAKHAVTGVWDYADFFSPKNREWYDKWISFDCVLADRHRDLIWCGIASFTGDVLYAFDRKTGKFRNMNYSKVGDKYDAKFHRALLHDSKGMIWAATALYHDPDNFNTAPGGAIVRFDPVTEKMEVVARPFPGVYIQSIELDAKRNILYGQTYNPEFFFTYDIKTGKAKNLGPIGASIGLAQSEQLSIDKNGTVWGSWGTGSAWANSGGNRQARLWSFNPADNKPTHHRVGLPSIEGSGFSKPDGTHTGPDGAVYMGSSEGHFFRIDPESHKIEYIGKPAPGRRLTGMVNAADGNIYGSCGNGGAGNLFRYETATGKLDFLGPIFDSTLGVQAYQIHNMTITADGTIYGGENDVPNRSSYLWEIKGAVFPEIPF